MKEYIVRAKELAFSSTARDTFVLFSGNILSAFWGFVFTLIVARSLSISDFGIFAFSVHNYNFLCMALFGLFSRENKDTLNKGLEKTKSSVLQKISRAISGKSKIDDEVLDNLEEVLISSDVGVDTTNAAAMDAYRQQFWTDVADTIINHFKINGVLTVPGTGLVAPSGGGPVTGTSVTGKIS